MTEAEFILCEILVLRCQRGDKSAAAELVGLFKKPVLYYLWRLVGLEEEACFRFSEQSLLHASFCLSGIISAPRRHCSHFPFFWFLMAFFRSGDSSARCRRSSGPPTLCPYRPAVAL